MGIYDLVGEGIFWRARKVWPPRKGGEPGGETETDDARGSSWVPGTGGLRLTHHPDGQRPTKVRSGRGVRALSRQQNITGEAMEKVSRENAEHYVWGGVCDGWHLLKSSGLSVIQERVPPGGAEVKHYHEKAHQFFFVLSGEATMEIQDKRLVLGPQQGISIPSKITHRLLNEANEDLSFIVVSAPMSHGDRVIGV